MTRSRYRRRRRADAGKPAVGAQSACRTTHAADRSWRIGAHADLRRRGTAGRHVRDGLLELSLCRIRSGTAGSGGATHQELTVDQIRRLILEAGCEPVERDTLYNVVREWPAEDSLP